MRLMRGMIYHMSSLFHGHYMHLEKMSLGNVRRLAAKERDRVRHGLILADNFIIAIFTRYFQANC